MNIQAINNQASFKALIIPKNQVFTSEQQTIVKEVETVANKRYPHDKNLRSYIDYLEKDAFCDLLLKSNEDNKSVEMYVKNQYAKEATYLETFSKERPVEEIAFLEYCDMIQTNSIYANKTIKGVTGMVIALCMAVIGAIAHKSCTKDTIPVAKEQVVNPIKDSLQRVSKDTLDLTKQLMKK